MKILKTLRKRGLALFLVLTMCISLLPVQAMAAELDLWPADELELICEKEEHSHDAECYTAVSRLTCTVEENHVHGEDCYVEGEPALLCTEDHAHGDECYVPGEPVLVCDVEENHVHGEDCYTVETSLTCELEEHEHSEECYTDAETPAAVQMLLDAVEELKLLLPVTPDNLDMVDEFLYNTCYDLLDAAFEQGYGERDDVQEAGLVLAETDRQVEEIRGQLSASYKLNNLTVEYWITNSSIGVAGGINGKSDGKFNTVSVNSNISGLGQGVSVSQVIDQEITDTAGVRYAFWKARVITERSKYQQLWVGNKATENDPSIVDVAEVKYTSNKGWQYRSDLGGNWVDFDSNCQFVAYYLRVEELRNGVTMKISDWPTMEFTSSSKSMVVYQLYDENDLPMTGENVNVPTYYNSVDNTISRIVVELASDYQSDWEIVAVKRNMPQGSSSDVNAKSALEYTPPAWGSLNIPMSTAGDTFQFDKGGIITVGIQIRAKKTDTSLTVNYYGDADTPVLLDTKYLNTQVAGSTALTFDGFLSVDGDGHLSVTPGIYGITMSSDGKSVIGIPTSAGGASLQLTTSAANYQPDYIRAEISTNGKTLNLYFQPLTYAVTFDSQGGTDVAAQSGIAYGGKAVKPADPTKDDYQFAGWYKEAGCTTEWKFDTDTVTGNITLYAKWVKRVTATFDLNYTGAGTPHASQSGDSPLTVTKPADPTRTDYTFLGWFTEATGGTEVNFTTGAPVITTDTTYYAHWEKNTAGYTVKYYYDSETSTEWTQLGSDVTGTATIGNPISYVTVPGSVAGLPTGYVFDHATYGSADAEITASSNVVVTETAAANVVKVYFAIDKIGGENGGDNTPDRYQTTVTFNVENGYWGKAGTDDSPKTKVVTLEDGNGKWSENGSYTLTEDDLTYGTVGSNPDAAHRNGDDSCWNLEGGSTPAGQVVTKTNNSFTYTYPAKLLMTVEATGINRVYNGQSSSVAVTVKDADTKNNLTGATIAYYSDPLCTTEIANSFTNVVSTTVYVKVTCPGYVDKVVSATVRITPATLTVTMGNVTKVYDGTTDVSEENLPAFTVDGIVDDEDVSVVLGAGGSVAYTNKDVGVRKNVTAIGLELYGTDAANYTLDSTSVTNKESTITPRPVTVTLGAATKMYDGSTSVPADQVSISLDGVLDADMFMGQSLVGVIVTGTVTYDTKDVSVLNGKTITAHGVALIGSAVMNYTLVDAAGNPVTTLDVTNDASTITPRPVTLTSADATKTYDGTPLTKNAQTDVTVTGDGFVAGEGVASYNITGSRTYVGSCKNDFSYHLKDGTNAGNYIITQEMGKLKVQGKVIYDANGGTGAPADSEPVDLGGTVTVSTVKPTRDNFTFLGWATTDDATVPDVGSSVQMGTETTENQTNITLYAVWSQDTYTVNVTYKLTDDGKDMTDHTENMPEAQKTATVNYPYGWSVVVSFGGMVLPGATITAPDTITADGKTYVQDVLLSDYDLVGTAPAKGETVNVTLVYALDVQGGTDPDGKETGDLVPDYQQAFVKYVSGDIEKGTVTGDIVKVYPLEMDAESGAYTDDITPGTEDVTVTPKTGYVFVWEPDPTEVLHVEGGKTYVFTAIFDIGKYPTSVEFYYDEQKDEDATVNGEADYESIFTFAPQAALSYNGSNYALDRIENNGLTVSTDPEENVVKVYYALDEDQNGNPDIYDATMIYRIDGGTWDGETGNAQTAGRKVVLAVSKWDEVTQKREDLNPTVADRKVPAGTHDEEHTGSGVWSAVSGTEINDPASEALVLAAGETYIFQLTFQPMGATLVDIVNNGELNASSHEWVYDGAYHNVTAVVAGADGVVYNAPEYSTDGGETWSVTPPSVRNVAEGTVTVQVRATSSGYKTLTAAYTMKINPRPVTITVNNASKTAGWIDPAFSGSITSGSLVRSGDLGQITYVRSEAGEEVGTYSLTANYTHNDNYNVTVVRGVLTIYADTTLPPPDPTTPGGPIIPETNPPLGPSPDDGVIIEDAEIPLANAVGLNDTDHFAYIIGYENDTVRPLNKITRAEAVTIFFRLMSDEYRSANWSTENSFSDVKAGSWYNNAVSTCLKAGVLEHFAQDAAFLPNQAITRAEFASIAAGFVSDEITGEEVGDFSDTEGHWASLYIRKAVQAGWIYGVGGNKFAPDETITRAEVMTMINRMLDRVPDAEHMLPTMKVWIDNPEGNWYYEAVQEATNGHEYERDEMGVVETWTGLADNRDWTALEAEWAANGGSTTPVAPAQPAEGEAGSDSEAGND